MYSGDRHRKQVALLPTSQLFLPRRASGSGLRCRYVRAEQNARIKARSKPIKRGADATALRARPPEQWRGNSPTTRDAPLEKTLDLRRGEEPFKKAGRDDENQHAVIIGGSQAPYSPLPAVSIPFFAGTPLPKAARHCPSHCDARIIEPRAIALSESTDSERRHIGTKMKQYQWYLDN
jgi:hypothetical protein